MAALGGQLLGNEGDFSYLLGESSLCVSYLLGESSVCVSYLLGETSVCVSHEEIRVLRV